MRGASSTAQSFTDNFPLGLNNCPEIRLSFQLLIADPALWYCMLLHKRVRGKYNWKSNQRRNPLQQMQDWKRTRWGKRSKVTTALCAHEGERGGICPSHHLLWSYFYCLSEIRRLLILKTNASFLKVDHCQYEPPETVASTSHDENSCTHDNLRARSRSCDLWLPYSSSHSHVIGIDVWRPNIGRSPSFFLPAGKRTMFRSQLLQNLHSFHHLFTNAATCLDVKAS